MFFFLFLLISTSINFDKSFSVLTFWTGAGSFLMSLEAAVFFHRNPIHLRSRESGSGFRCVLNLQFALLKVAGMSDDLKMQMLLHVVPYNQFLGRRIKRRGLRCFRIWFRKLTRIPTKKKTYINFTFITGKIGKIE